MIGIIDDVFILNKSNRIVSFSAFPSKKANQEKKTRRKAQKIARRKNRRRK